ncbi:MAG: biotin/lipoyl-binding protein [Pirellulaceae bacterium]
MERSSSDATALLFFCLGCAGLGSFIVPLPRRITATGVVDFADAATVYVRVPGRVESMLVEHGDRVAEGQALLRLKNFDLERQHVRLVSQSAEADLQAATLRRRALSDASLMEQWDSRVAAVTTLHQRASYAASQVEQLVLRSPCDGMVLPVLPCVVRNDAFASNEARHLTELCGQHLDAGCRCCRIGDPKHLEVVLQVDAQQRADIELGTVVHIHFAQAGIGVIESTVDAISEIRQEDQADRVIRQREFRIVCSLPRTERLMPGTEVNAKLSTSPQSIHQRLINAWRANF